MKSICFFASYFHGSELPYYIGVYLKELRRHFSEVVLLSEPKELSPDAKRFLEEEKIAWLSEKNEGYDFGLWYIALKKYNAKEYAKIAMVNDSCVLFRSLDEFMIWSDSNNADVQGLTLSDAITPHIQSYFLLFKPRAIPLMLDYFEKHKFYKSVSDVIRYYEVGLSADLASRGIRLSAFIDNNGYTGEFSPYYHCIDYHVRKGIPLIKKKILFMSYRRDELFTLARMGFRLSPEYYVALIKKYNSSLLIDLDRLLRENRPGMNGGDVLKYNTKKMAIKLGRPIYKLIKRA